MRTLNHLFGLGLTLWGAHTLYTKLALTGQDFVSVFMFPFGILAMAAAETIPLASRIRALEKQLAARPTADHA